ncbi:P-loop NTPase fold protein [Azospirillum brasilense]|uniref:KAP NTPase domain-containing protein n=1 Tax=Azospirillum brasilense TaxID=192 RepID=A0A6L3AZN7_AZOBR|nr:P-loop NTPase fold protein [Azospirillum brasilense]KAA0684894.1 hypothetical protein DS837_15545 [Azospirillum brasilense]
MTSPTSTDSPKAIFFGLQPFGENFANLVQRIDEPLVIALDGPWGSGKSPFARQWAGLLRQRKVPVIVFDAFANDHQPDASLALAAEITALARQHLPEDRKRHCHGNRAGV